jgi:hypothetical protein
MSGDDQERANLLEAYTASLRGESFPRRYKEAVSSDPDEEMSSILGMLKFVEGNLRESEYYPLRPGALNRIEKLILESMDANEEKELTVGSELAPSYSREPHGSNSELIQAGYAYDGLPSESSLVTLRISLPGQEKERCEVVRVSADSGLVIGRGRDVDVRISDPSRRLSRQHASLSLNDGKIVVTDLNSTNGTYHNGQKIGNIEINEESQLILGSVMIEVVKIEQT